MVETVGMGMMRYRWLLVLSLLALVGYGAAEKAFVPGDEHRLSLFAGGDLRGWVSSKDSDWKVENGLMSGTKGRVLNRWCWVDFEMEMMVKGEGNLLLRVGSSHVGHIGFKQPGYKIDLTKGEFLKDSGEFLAGGKAQSNDEWLRVVVKASKNKFSATANGKQLFEFEDDSSPLKGRFGFETDGKPVHVRFMRVKPLNVERNDRIPTENFYCFVCHGNFEEDDLVLNHEEEDVECASCHGASLIHRSDEDNVTPPDIMYRHIEVSSMCLKCHDTHDEQEHPDGEEISDNPQCTDCHGSHWTW